MSIVLRQKRYVGHWIDFIDGLLRMGCRNSKSNAIPETGITETPDFSVQIRPEFVDLYKPGDVIPIVRVDTGPADRMHFAYVCNEYGMIEYTCTDTAGRKHQLVLSHVGGDLTPVRTVQLVHHRVQ